MDVASQHSIIDSLRKKKGTEPYTTTALVTRIDEDGIYVSLPGSDMDTFIENTSVSVSVGDMVDVFVSNYDTHITGNRTDIAPTSSGVITIIQQATSPLEKSISMQESSIVMHGSNINMLKSDMNIVNSNMEIYNSAFVIEDGELRGLSGIIVDSLDSKYIDTEWLNADFAKVGIADIERLFATSGIIKDLATEEGHITGELDAVRINADSITSGTLTTDRLIIRDKNSDTGILWAINNGVVEQTELNEEELERLTLNGKVITAESITADKIRVTDLIAFGATIGEFIIGKDPKVDDDGNVVTDEDGQTVYEPGYIKSIDGSIRLGSDGKWHFGNDGTIGDESEFHLAFDVGGTAGVYFMYKDKVIGSFQNNTNNETILRATNAELLPKKGYWNEEEQSRHVDVGCVRYVNRSNGNTSIVSINT